MRIGQTSGVLPSSPGRRQLLKVVSTLAAAACSAPVVAWAVNDERRALALVHRRTGEHLDTVYWAHGRYRPDALHAINRILRDHRAEAVRPIDLDLIELLYRIKRRLAVDEPFEVFSGYRTPSTNAWLRHHRRGVAGRSFHMFGMAVDLRLAEGALPKLHKAALSLKGGGVGYYPDRGFVHLDVGPVRTWRG